jgi:hypothetical protein
VRAGMPVRVSRELYNELKRIQKRMWDTSGVEISLAEASVIYHRKKSGSKRPDSDFQFKFV